jgi:hypothetical protein
MSRDGLSGEVAVNKSTILSTLYVLRGVWGRWAASDDRVTGSASNYVTSGLERLNRRSINGVDMGRKNTQ